MKTWLLFILLAGISILCLTYLRFPVKAEKEYGREAQAQVTPKYLIIKLRVSDGELEGAFKDDLMTPADKRDLAGSPFPATKTSSATILWHASPGCVCYSQGGTTYCYGTGC